MVNCIHLAKSKGDFFAELKKASTNGNENNDNNIYTRNVGIQGNFGLRGRKCLENAL